MRNLQLLIVAMVACLSGCDYLGNSSRPARAPFVVGGGGAVLHFDRFFYDGVKFQFHEGSGKYDLVTLTPSSTGSGPFIHLTDGSVMDVSNYTEEEHLPFVTASENAAEHDMFNPTPVDRQLLERGECKFVDGKLTSTRFDLHDVGLLRGPLISLTACGNQLCLSKNLKYPEVKAALGEPDRIVPYGSQANAPKNAK
jgi:hypothetical protein